jgi:hypothetical protein
MLTFFIVQQVINVWFRITKLYLKMHFQKNKTYIKVERFLKRGYIIVLLSYLLLCILYWWFFIHNYCGTQRYLDAHWGIGFAISFSASLLDDLIMFLVLGIIGTIIQAIISRSPDEEDFDSRVKALMNSKHVEGNDKLVSYLKSYLTTFLAYISKMNITMIVKEYDENENAYKIFTEYDITLSNMCRDSEYNVKDPKITVYSDISVNGDFGHVSYLGTYDPTSLRIINTIIDEDKREDIVPIKGHFEREFNYKIPKDGMMAWKLRFTIWSKIYDDKYDEPEKWFTHSLLRYAQNVKISLENHLNSQHNIKFDVKKFSTATNERDLIVSNDILGYNSDGPKIIAPEIEYHPGDTIEFWFYKPSNDLEHMENLGGGVVVS